MGTFFRGVRVELAAKIEFVVTGQAPISLEWNNPSGKVARQRVIIAGWMSASRGWLAGNAWVKIPRCICIVYQLQRSPLLLKGSLPLLCDTRKGHHLSYDVCKTETDVWWGPSAVKFHAGYIYSSRPKKNVHSSHRLRTSQRCGRQHRPQRPQNAAGSLKPCQPLSNCFGVGQDRCWGRPYGWCPAVQYWLW